jgi:hypothetical protein
MRRMFPGGDYVDPSAHRYITIDYAAPPHFYRMDRIIVVYVGTYRQTLLLLASVLGPPFTEEHFYRPGPLCNVVGSTIGATQPVTCGG